MLNTFVHLFGYNLIQKQFLALIYCSKELRKLMKNPRNKPPITPFILRCVHNVLNFNSKFEVTMWALYLKTFFLMLRKSNVTAATNKEKEKILKGRILLG